MSRVIEKMISFSPDNGLMYLIQNVTKQSSDEILGFFYDFGKQVLIIGIDNMEGKSIRKQIEGLYPGTVIPFKVLVKGRKQDYAWDDASRKYINLKEPAYNGHIEVTFPDNPTYLNTEKLMELIMEKELLGGSSLPDFEAPKSRTPKLYRELIKQILTNKV